MEKYYEKEGMASAGEASAKEVRDGKYNAEFKEPEESYESYMYSMKEKDSFGGFVGRATGRER